MSVKVSTSRKLPQVYQKLTIHEVVHGQDAGEDTLIVAIEQTTDTSEQGDTEDFGILDQGIWSAVAHQGLPAIEGDIEGANRGGSRHT